jgi:hypothetical protein
VVVATSRTAATTPVSSRIMRRPPVEAEHTAALAGPPTVVAMTVAPDMSGA